MIPAAWLDVLLGTAGCAGVHAASKTVQAGLRGTEVERLPAAGVLRPLPQTLSKGVVVTLAAFVNRPLLCSTREVVGLEASSPLVGCRAEPVHAPHLLPLCALPAACCRRPAAAGPC